MKVLVTGGTGTIGKPLCDELLRQKFAVAALTRNMNDAREIIHARTHILEWDPSKHDIFWAEKCGEIDAVVNLAGAPIADKRWTRERRKLLMSSRINAAETIIRAINENKITPKVLINTSAVGYYDIHPDKEFTEEDNPGSGFLSEICKEWEKTAVKAEDLGLRVCRIRIGAVLSKNGGALQKMLPIFKLGLGGKLGNGSQWFSWIHITDIINAIIHLISNNTLKGAFNLVSPQPVTNREFTKAMSNALNKPAFLTVPKAALRLRFGELTDILTGSRKVLPKRIGDSGFQFTFREILPALEDLLK
ncbi:MAG: TIGR01777 family protein [bacterium]|nr:TIGR01777 family protein [bacterium]